MSSPRSSSAASMAMLLSAAVHVGIGYGVGRVQLLGSEPVRAAPSAGTPVMLIPWADPPAPPEADPPALASEPKPEPDPLREIERLRLGIAQSPHDSENWIGFSDPTPHSAPLSEVEQPALDPDAGKPGRAAPADVAAADQREAADRVGAADAAAEQAAGARETSAVAGTAAEERRPEAVAEAQREGERVGADALEASAAVAGAPEEGPDDSARPLMGEVAGREMSAADERDASFVGPPREAARAVTEASTPGAGAQREIAGMESGTQNPGAVPGERSERESNAVSREMAIEVRPGRPAAAEGLEIITRRPEFSRVTRLMAAPARNPRLRVTFDREGLVRHVEFIETTGIRDVDDPVQHAVYRWTARGRALSELPLGDPRAGVTITVTILLR
ncbi:MAG: hypothetical protein KF699_05835 [Phycisphaeraceae bacterium]|nr:hypothetical protein [Phycisphaeraceae bacterium]